MTKIKICGITNLDDALAAVDAGADALGFIFYEKSLRYISPESARHIIDRLPGEVVTVGVFANESVDRLIDMVHASFIKSIQLHGHEPPEYAETVGSLAGCPVTKAFGVTAEFTANVVLDYKVDAILLDAASSDGHGGTGKTFDWEIARALNSNSTKMYLAGGLSPENVGEAIAIAAPYAVDACSRIESSPGKKDHAKVKMFVEAVRKADGI